ncbi:A/G-specific adenine glycosylase [Ketogulonicigenium robustum]|uniref:Adenine DNA glycosylase n=1 Tax=Ketogulonicigenium robustum TaxID=92947 RepID=A0A1W6P320_9RHOB|nr:A/G-specific adenine glycosylase [Ketogulonicigenium robustum]ARO15740.1 A/G-specific adenine glycosylase [Ketogulonicigenium robustum]
MSVESDLLLHWYDQNARQMPWRIPPALSKAGQRPDPYHIWLSEVMLQQTTVAAVKAYFLKFTALWPTVEALAAAPDSAVMEAWAGLGYYARARNLLKCARTVVADHGGRFPASLEGLLALPGVGPYTAAAIAAIAFDLPATVVDGNVERVMARLFDEETPLPPAKPILTAHAARLTPQQRPGDYAQAVMDLGATICTPKSPACVICPLTAGCLARAAGTAHLLPRKLPKKPQPTRFGLAYVVQRADGAFLLERRPDKGLLGGMLGWPGSGWAETPPIPTPPLQADWQAAPDIARHTFTHFHLELTVMVARAPLGANPEVGSFIPLDPTALPTVMRKVHAVAAAALQG